MRVATSLLAASLLAMTPVAAQAQTPAGLAGLCKGRAGCAVAKSYPAGRTAQGQPIRVVELAVPVKRNYKSVAGTCPPKGRELWVVVGHGPGRQARKIMLLCNDGYGAAGVGDDRLKVAANRLVHIQNGGSAWRWDVTRTIQLVPLKVLGERTCSWHTIAPGFSTTRWSWTRFQGTRAMRPKQCNRGNKPYKEMGCVPSMATYRSLLIPRLTEATALAGDTAPILGSCALTIRESAKPAYTVYGKPKPDGAAIRILAVGKRDLLVTVIDRHIRTKARSWVRQDHLELWVGPYPSIDCDTFGAPLTQWGVTLGDGKVHRGFGKAKGDPVVVARRVTRRGGKTVIALRIRLPKLRYFGATVVYSKARDGRQVRLTGTSRIDRHDPRSVGGFFDIAAKAARCAVRDGVVTLVDSGKPTLLHRE